MQGLTLKCFLRMNDHSSNEPSVHNGSTCFEGQSAWALAPSLFGEILALGKSGEGVATGSVEEYDRLLPEGTGLRNRAPRDFQLIERLVKTCRVTNGESNVSSKCTRSAVKAVVKAAHGDVPERLS